MPKCKYCGMNFPNMTALTVGTCGRHPNGIHKGRHALYEGSDKQQYTCKYCGIKFANLNVLCAQPCGRHPNGPHKGRHAPALN